MWIARIWFGLLLFAATFAALTTDAGAVGSSDFVIQLESDPGGSELLTFVTYPTFTDLVEDSNRTINAGTPRIASTASTTGLTFDGSNYIVMLESDPGGSELLTFVTYPTFTDLVEDSNRTINAGTPRIASTASTTGLTFDGSNYIVMLESDPGGSELLTFVTYPTFTDLVEDSNRTINAGTPRIASTASTTGLTFDGSNYIVMLESDPGGSELLTFVTYPTFTDLVEDSNRTINAGTPRIASTASTTGLMAGSGGIDSDDDGVADEDDLCPGQDDTIDVDADELPDCIDPLIDSDDDGVADEDDLCPGQDDTIDVDADELPDCIDPLIDSDDDGVADEDDLCDDTTDDPAPPRLQRNRNWPSPTETFGCSPSQIIEDAGLGRGHETFGVSNSALDAWLANIDG